MEHVQQLAKMAGAGYSPEGVSEVYAVLEATMKPAEAPLGWKVTPGAKPRAYYNILNHQKLDFLKVLREGGLIPKKYLEDAQYQPAYKLLEGMIVDGCDFNTNGGLCKIWAYTNMDPIEKLLENPYLPEGVHANADLLRALGLNSYFFLAADFEKNSSNVYFPWQPKQRNTEWVTSFSEAVGNSISDVALQGILETCEDTIGIGITFNWDSNEIQRACFYNTSPSAAAPALDDSTREIREKIRTEMPTLLHEPSFFYNWSIGKAGEFAKIEKDYSGDFWAHVESVYNLDPEGVHAMKEAEPA